MFRNQPRIWFQLRVLWDAILQVLGSHLPMTHMVALLLRDCPSLSEWRFSPQRFTADLLLHPALEPVVLDNHGFVSFDVALRIRSASGRENILRNGSDLISAQKTIQYPQGVASR